MPPRNRPDARPYRAKIAECYALCDASDDLLMQEVYRAMASEFEARAGPERIGTGTPQPVAPRIAVPAPLRAHARPRSVPQAR